MALEPSSQATITSHGNLGNVTLPRKISNANVPVF